MNRHRTLDASLVAYRIGDATGEWPVFSGEGAKKTPGRWNEQGQGPIYASLAYSTALLEKLVGMTILPPNQHYIEIAIERGVSYEELNEAHAEGWYRPDRRTARAYGGNWYRECRSCVLIVPCVVTRVDRNILINTEHPDFAHVSASRERKSWLDERLFGK